MASTLGASSSHSISFFLRYILFPPQLLEGSAKDKNKNID
jgi:hypothetical protein